MGSFGAEMIGLTFSWPCWSVIGTSPSDKHLQRTPRCLNVSGFAWDEGLYRMFHNAMLALDETCLPWGFQYFPLFSVVIWSMYLVFYDPVACVPSALACAEAFSAIAYSAILLHRTASSSYRQRASRHLCIWWFRLLLRQVKFWDKKNSQRQWWGVCYSNLYDPDLLGHSSYFIESILLYANEISLLIKTDLAENGNLIDFHETFQQ